MAWMSSCFVRLSKKVRGESQSSWSWGCWSWFGLQRSSSKHWQFVTAHGLMWLNCFLCGLPWTAKLSFLSFFLPLPSTHQITDCLFCLFSLAFVRRAIHTSSQCPRATGEFYYSQTFFLKNTCYEYLLTNACPSPFLCNRIRFMGINRINYH